MSGFSGGTGGLPQSGPDGGLGRDQGTGAARFLGEMGGYPIGQVDVRTDMMKQLEQSAMPLLQQLLGNPAGVSQMFGQAAGPVPGIPQSSLSSLLFGGSTGQATPPQGGPGLPPSMPPAGPPSMPPGGSPPPAFPGFPQPLSPQGGWPTGPVAPGTGFNGGDGYNPLGSGGVLPAGTPIAGGPYTGLPAGAPMPTPFDYTKFGPGPIDETGSRFAEPATDPKLAGDSTANQFSRWAKSLGGARPPEQTKAAFKVPKGLESLFEGSEPTVGDAASMVGDLIKMSSNLRDKNLTPEQSLAYANQLWATLPPEQQAHVARNSASIYGGGGNNPTLEAFFADKFTPGMMGGGGQADAATVARAAAVKAQQSDPNVIAMFDRINARRGIQSLASGGIMDPDALKIVGEQGPELIAPMASGQQAVVPLGDMQTQSILPPAAPAGPGTGNFAASPIQGQGTGMIEQLLQQNPEGQTFDTARTLLTGQGGILDGGNAGQGVMQALQPLFQQNLQFGLNELTNRVPSVFNSGAAIEGADLTSRALNDYNLLASQAMMQGQQNTLGGLGMLGQLASQAGGGQFGRSMQAGSLATQRDLGLGSLGLQQNQQQWNQTINPTLQLLLAAMGMATPTAYQTVVPGKK